MEFRNRITGLVPMKGSQLSVNPNNFRGHTVKQSSLLTLALEKIGWINGAVAYEDPEWGVTLIDGHLRKGVAADDVIPVLMTDLTRDEAREALLSFDYIGSLANEIEEKRKELEKHIGYSREEMASVARDAQSELSEISAMVPLAIVLTSDEYRVFNEAKRILGLQQDKAALMRLCEMVVEDAG